MSHAGQQQSPDAYDRKQARLQSLWQEGQACPYHGSILRSEVPKEPAEACASPMERFEAESLSDQPALFVRPDTGDLSTSKDCTCGASVREWIDRYRRQGERFNADKRR